MLRRSRQFAIDCGHLVLSLEVNAVNHAYGGQLIRSGSSAGANYRATRRAKSTSGGRIPNCRFFHVRLGGGDTAHGGSPGWWGHQPAKFRNAPHQTLLIKLWKKSWMNLSFS